MFDKNASHFSQVACHAARHSRLAAGALLLLALLTALPSRLAASAVLPDGAVGVNAAWEQGKSKVWWIELQGEGADLITEGVNREDDSMIRQGIHELDFGFARQNPVTGEFTGTAGGDVGPEFHSTSLFVEAAARATLLLENYHPLTYKKDAAFYQAKVAGYQKSLSAAAGWLTSPGVAATGQAYDTPFTHRRYLLAAGLAEVGALAGDPLLLDAADRYADDGLAQQLHSGTKTVPLQGGSSLTVSLNGVNPEEGGYDVSYQAYGILFAERYLPCCRSLGRKAALLAMTQAGLTWEQPWIAADGVANTTGSTRVGIERNRDGSIKTPAYSAIYDAFEKAYGLLRVPAFSVAADRVIEGGTSVTGEPVDAQGAVGTVNIAADRSKAAPWSIAEQKTGADLIASGVERDDPAGIAAGCAILDWGWVKLTGGSQSESWYYGEAAFLEASARGALLLKNYTPATSAETPAQAAFYAAETAKWTSAGQTLAAALSLPATAAKKEPEIAQSPARLSCLATALITEGVLSDDAALKAASVPYLQATLKLQNAGGEFPEEGDGDLNYQALTMTYLARYAGLAGPAAPELTPITDTLDGSIAWESLWISPAGSGTISGPVASGGVPAAHTISAAFLYAGALTGSPLAVVDAIRLDDYFLGATLPVSAD